MAADRLLRAAADAAAMPPPPPPIAYRNRGVPPAPKVPLWQADAYLALAKVPGGKAWTPNLAHVAQGMNLGPAARIVNVAAVGGPPPAK